MTPERHARAKEIFLEVLACPVDGRETLLVRRCEDDPSLRLEIEKLLAHHDERTITPDTRAPTAVTGEWRQGGQRLNLDDQGSTGPVKVRLNESPDSKEQDLPPGTIVAGRYRIVSLLGRGGMGVVYRADDLTLRQQVALKFLSPIMANNEAWLERFRNEVRMAREVTHPSVCRVFDIGQANGQHFLSMEYVDGEDLASLIKRIGRLPREKAIDIARQICIGLAAAHAAGILHRDLKPANIMLDGNGRVRITDFGLAAAADSIRAGDVRSGTPAYMAPEQIAGLDVSIQSDIYSLGLIIYELFSGRPAFDAKSNEEFAELHRSGQPIPLSKLVNDVDQEVEQVVESCLRKHAHDRPASALAVAAALPGTDLLAAALAANVTPSPEMVAAARPERVRSIGANYFALIAAMLFVGFMISRDLAKFPWERPSAKPPAVLVERAQDLIKKTHPSAARGDSAFGYCDVDEAMALATGRSQPIQGAKVLAGGADSGLVFWYRQSAGRLDPSDMENLAFGAGRVRPSDPSSLSDGQVSTALDLSGRLLLFVARIGSVGPHEASLSCDESQALWMPFLDSAGLSLADLTVMEPLDVSIVDADQRCAWTAPDPGDMDESLFVDFMARNGIPVFFAVRKSDDSAAYHKALKDLRRRKNLVTTSLRLLLLAATVVAIPWAWRNHRAGRIDRRGAWRLAAFVATIQLFVWVLRARHAFDFNVELLRACLAVMRAIGTAALVAVFYMALEPYARRNWPQILIAWSRILSGCVRDKLVGEHVLVGVSVGCFWALILAAERSFVGAMGWTARHSVVSDQFGNKLLGARAALAGYLDAIPLSIVYGLLLVLLLTALRVFIRRPRWAAALFVLLLLPLLLPRAAHSLTMLLAVGAGVAGVAVWVISRFGLLSLTIAFFVVHVLNTTPITVDPSVWYAEATFCTSMIVIAITVFGYWAARRQPIAELRTARLRRPS